MQAIQKVEVKNVKTFRGMEGYGFNATLYADGKKIGLVIDSAHGGCYEYEFADKVARVVFEQFVAALPPKAMPVDAEEWEKSLYVDGFRQLDMDEYVGGLVDAYETARALAKHAKTWLTFTTGGKALQIRHGGDIAGRKAYVLAKYPDAVFG